MRVGSGGVDDFSVLKIYCKLSVIKTGICRQSLNLTYLQVLLVCQFTFKAHGSLIFIGSYLAMMFVKHQPINPSLSSSVLLGDFFLYN